MASSPTVVLITGANVGIGYYTAKVIASSLPHYHVIMTARSSQKLEVAFNELKQESGIKGQLSSLQLDVTDDGSIDAAVKKVEEQFGRLDVLVNNAGFIPNEGTLREQYAAIMDTNVAGPAVVAEKFHPLLLKSKNPYSIFITSGLGSLSMAADYESPMAAGDWTTYRISKSALNALVIQEYKHKRKEGFKVFAICPGLVRSNLRGTKEEQRSAGGHAGDPEVSGKTILEIIEGKRDADAGKFVHKDGVYPW